jgi:hypothetical protein
MEVIRRPHRSGLVTGGTFSQLPAGLAPAPLGRDAKTAPGRAGPGADHLVFVLAPKADGCQMQGPLGADPYAGAMLVSGTWVRVPA